MHIETSDSVRRWLTTLFQSKAAHSAHWNLCNKMHLYVQGLNTNNVCSKPSTNFPSFHAHPYVPYKWKGSGFNRQELRQESLSPIFSSV